MKDSPDEKELLKSSYYEKCGEDLKDLNEDELDQLWLSAKALLGC